MATTKQKRVPPTGHTRFTKFIEQIAKGLLWAAAGLTIAILLYIIGYIIFRGFYFDVIEEGVVTAYSEEALAVADSPEHRLIIIANNGVRIESIMAEDLHGMYTGRPANWGGITAQDLEIAPVALSSGDYTGLGEYLHQGEGFDSAVQYVSSVEEMVQKVRTTRGAIGYVPASMEDSIQGCKTVPIRRLSIAAHPSVKAVVENQRLRFVPNNSIPALLSGEIENWTEINGIDLPVNVILPPEDHYIYQAMVNTIFDGNFEPENSVTITDTYEEMINLLDTQEGAVGITRFEDRNASEFDFLPIQFHRTGMNLSLSFLLEPPRRAGRVGGISSIIMNTLFMIALTLLIATPIGVAAAIYLVEYAKQGKLVYILRLGTETLAGIPSIIFGLFGFIVFVNYLGIGIGLISGTLTITIMILPTIIRTSEEALKTVPASYREGSLALGATKWQTITKVVIPAATPGILTGVILAIGRAIGETAALLFTMGFDYRMARSLTSSARVLSVHLYQLVKEGISFERAFATGTILIIIILAVNITATKLISRMNRMAKG
ncbi:MAG: phosphate ABC transporter permease PstA [Spirochaetia bacterium]